MLLGGPPLVGLYLIGQRLVGLNRSMLLVVHGVVEELLGLMRRLYHPHGPICPCVRKLWVWLLADLVLICLSLLLIRSLLVVVCGLLLVRLVGVS